MLRLLSCMREARTSRRWRTLHETHKHRRNRSCTKCGFCLANTSHISLFRLLPTIFSPFVSFVRRILPLADYISITLDNAHDNNILRSCRLGLFATMLSHATNNEKNKM